MKTTQHLYTVHTTGGNGTAAAAAAAGAAAESVPLNTSGATSSATLGTLFQVQK